MLPAAPKKRHHEVARAEAARAVIRTPATRSALRFAMTVVVVDLILLALFGESSAALLGSLAVSIHLYFLDFEGDLRERFVGQGVATLVGAVAVILGVLCSAPLWLAVFAALLVSCSFAYLRLLRGYVARSAVGLQGAFFLPVMTAAHLGDAPALVGGWLVGSAVSVAAALVVVPNRRSGLIRELLAQWLRAAERVSSGVQSGVMPAQLVDDLEDRREALLAAVAGSISQPGAAGRRQRALSNMVAGARWSMHVAERISPKDPSDTSTLAATSAEAFSAAAELVVGDPFPRDLPDLPTERARDFKALAVLGSDELRAHYSARLLSIGAMSQLFHAARYRGREVPVPDLGYMDAARPRTILRENLRWHSVWLRNAWRTGAGAATCVAIVRVVGVEHGVWVVLAALAVTQVTLSGVSGSKMMLRISSGAAAGVVLAGAVATLHLPRPVFLCALPVAAFAAKRFAGSRMVLAQMTFTLFALINFSVLSWPPHKGLEVVRVEDIALGALVAAVFSLLVFPSGVWRSLEGLRSTALLAARAYLAGNLAAVSDLDGAPRGLERRSVLEHLGAYETALDAAFMFEHERTAELVAHESAASTARDLLVGGDACAELAEFARSDPKVRPVAAELAFWWQRFAVQGTSDFGG